METQMTQLAILLNLAHDSLRRRLTEERTKLEMYEVITKGEALPPLLCYEYTREVADQVIPERWEEDSQMLLLLAQEHPDFATQMVPHWTFTQWQEANNECTPIALIRENIYQWLVSELEQWIEERGNAV